MDHHFLGGGVRQFFKQNSCTVKIGWKKIVQEEPWVKNRASSFYYPILEQVIAQQQKSCTTKR